MRGEKTFHLFFSGLVPCASFVVPEAFLAKSLGITDVIIHDLLTEQEIVNGVG